MQPHLLQHKRHLHADKVVLLFAAGSGYLKKLASANPELQQLEAQYEQLAAEDAAVLVTLRQRTARELEKVGIPQIV